MIRRVAVPLVLAVAVVVAGSVRAEHCSSPIYLLTNLASDVADPSDPNRTAGTPTIVSSAVGCIVIGQDLPETEPDESNTDFIYPGSNTLIVRWLEGTIPAKGTLTYAGTTASLSFYRTSNGIVEVVDSRPVRIDPVTTVTANEAEITVCRDADGRSCETRTYRTLASGPA